MSSRAALSDETKAHIREYVNDLLPAIVKVVRAEIHTIITKEVRAATERAVTERAAADHTNALTTPNTLAQFREIASTTSREIVRVACTQIQKNVYEKVVAEINEKIVPEVERTIRWANYQTEDTNEVVDDYRRAVESRTSAAGLITDGSRDSRVVTQHVRKFFGDED